LRCAAGRLQRCQHRQQPQQRELQHHCRRPLLQPRRCPQRLPQTTTMQQPLPLRRVQPAPHEDLLGWHLLRALSVGQ